MAEPTVNDPAGLPDRTRAARPERRRGARARARDGPSPSHSLRHSLTHSNQYRRSVWDDRSTPNRRFLRAASIAATTTYSRDSACATYSRSVSSPRLTVKTCCAALLNNYGLAYAAASIFSVRRSCWRTRAASNPPTRGRDRPARRKN